MATASTTTPAEPRPTAEAIKYHRVYARGPFNKKVNRLIAVLTKVREELRELIDLGETVQADWGRAGLDPYPEEDQAASYLRYAEEMAADADRFDWAVRAYLDELRSFVVRR